ncbi:MAG: hypothetical protein QOI96_310 [Verrucomicrobiota bacterium]
MGRKFNVVSAIGLLSILATDSGFAQGKPHSAQRRPHVINQQNGGQFRGVQRERFYRLSPEDQQTFRKNAERWLQMSPEERTLMRKREQVRQERIRGEAEAVIRDSGLRLDPTKRDLFQERYLQERRIIDRELRQEYETRRQQQLERLKREFQPPENSPRGAATSAPSLSTPPRR